MTQPRGHDRVSATPVTDLGPTPVVTPGVTRVLLVDDHRAFSEALAMAIGSFPDLACVGTPTTIAEALAAIPEAGPDVILMDIYLPDGNGIEAIAGIRALRPGVRILVMTGHTDVDVMARAASAGASGFLPKENSIAAILDAIRAARDGQMLVDGSTLAAILGQVGRAPMDPRGRGADFHLRDAVAGQFKLVLRLVALALK